jgi:curved DNA-binding protein
MPKQPWVDYYETLQVSPSADRETIERVYRLLAKRYHPDNDASGDADLFNEVRTAFEILSDPDARAAYDANYDRDRSEQWEVFRQDTADGERDDDRRLFHAVLSLLYIQRRRDPDNAGLAPSHMERMLGVPREHLDFPLWYLKKRKYVEVLETGLLAITVDGVDKLGSGELSLPANRLLTDHSSVQPGSRQEDTIAPYAIPDRTHVA